ncbi:MAG: hypothetical protein AB7N80_00170 [Bdellovibrionales bacterium]
MKSKTWLILSALLMSASLVVACGESSKGSSAANNPGVASCTQAGQVYLAQYNMCYSNTNCTHLGPNYGWVPQLNQCVAGVIGGGGTGGIPGVGNRHLWSGTIQFTGGGQGVYQQMMKDVGICGGGHLNSWSYLNCDQWNDRAEVAFEVMSNGTIPAYGYVDVTSFNDYNAYLPYTFTYQGNVSPININTGFELQAMGYGTGYNKVFQAQGNVGALLVGSSLLQQYRLSLIYGGQEIGYATVFLRY